MKDPHNLPISTKVNGEFRQDINTSDFIFNIPQIIAFCSQGTTLQAGSAILTGSPAGVGFAMKPARYLIPGDIVEITVGNVGTLVHGIKFA
jgi:2-keto-4-pentenoate hydratase/2-oxohepta-3-ene-1,7-dioic acid hydratase in catechol pathway